MISREGCLLFSLNIPFQKPFYVIYFERKHSTEFSISHSFPDIGYDVLSYIGWVYDATGGPK